MDFPRLLPTAAAVVCIVLGLMLCLLGVRHAACKQASARCCSFLNRPLISLSGTFHVFVVQEALQGSSLKDGLAISGLAWGNMRSSPTMSAKCELGRRKPVFGTKCKFLRESQNLASVEICQVAIGLPCCGAASV